MKMRLSVFSGADLELGFLRFNASLFELSRLRLLKDIFRIDGFCCVSEFMASVGAARWFLGASFLIDAFHNFYFLALNGE